MNDPDRDNRHVFKEIIMAFEQMNKERQMLINAQGDVLLEFSGSLNKYATGNDQSL